MYPIIIIIVILIWLNSFGKDIAKEFFHFRGVVINGQPNVSKTIFGIARLMITNSKIRIDHRKQRRINRGFLQLLEHQECCCIVSCFKEYLSTL